MTASGDLLSLTEATSKAGGSAAVAVKVTVSAIAITLFIAMKIGRARSALGSKGAVLLQTICVPEPSPIWHITPYMYGTIVNMKKTFHVDESLFREARVACGATTDTETVRLGLESLVRQAAYARLKALRGTEPGAPDVPRRRERQGNEIRP
jgi:hypothetical protein